MKKTANGKDDRDARIEALESRLMRLDPGPKVEVMEFGVGDEIFSIVDQEASHPLRVFGFDQNMRRILVMAPGDCEPRAWPVASVIPLEKCRAVGPDRIAAARITDPIAREFWQGKRAAQAAARAPEPPAAPKPPKYRWAD